MTQQQWPDSPQQQPAPYAQGGIPAQGYQQQPYAYPAPKPTVTPAMWIALGALVLAVVFTVVGDQSIVLNAGTPLLVGIIAALGALASAIVAMALQDRTALWSGLILGGALLVGAWASYDYYQVQQALDVARQCLQALGSC